MTPTLTSARSHAQRPVHPHVWRAVLLGLTLALLAQLGCGGVTRTPHEQAALLQRRANTDAGYLTTTRQLSVTLLERTKAQYDAYAAGQRPQPPVIDLLIISGGGDWGAFGAGFLKGWGTVPIGAHLRV